MTRLARSGRAPDAVYIIFGDIGQLEIDHVGQFVDIDAASGDVGRDQNRAGAVAERSERPLATAPIGLTQMAIDDLLDEAGQARARTWAGRSPDTVFLLTARVRTRELGVRDWSPTPLWLAVDSMTAMGTCDRVHPLVAPVGRTQAR